MEADVPPCHYRSSGIISTINSTTEKPRLPHNRSYDTQLIPAGYGASNQSRFRSQRSALGEPVRAASFMSEVLGCWLGLSKPHTNTAPR
jgi:hypothetical protein